ncbi:MAG TPA: acetolactate synthase large subunit [Actinomycetota bacterium]|jgi:acetolactate synthase-1/2/3 large subunit|nr:acetolactate synthase large subunit [Actinomycetota bacterium]
MTAVTGAQSLIDSLEAAGVDVVFGIPGGAILPAYDPLLDSPIRHVLMRHEQGAGHAAEGYAQVTGKPGVCMATSGPGATNLVTPIADAFMDSVPLVAITGQVPRPVIGNDAFQEADITGITMPITKHNYKVMEADSIPEVIAEAFHIATSGRPGPVLVDIPKDVLQAPTTFEWPSSINLPGYRPTVHPNRRQIRSAAELIRAAARPVFYVGGGVHKGRAADELRRLVEAVGAPVVTTLMARGIFPDDHELCLGMPGMHGNYAAVTAMQRADLLITLGARFDDRVTGKLDAFAPNAKIIHADVDPAEIGKNRAVDVPIVGDARLTIIELTKAVLHLQSKHAGADLSEWLAEANTWSRDYPLFYEQPGDGPVKPQYVVDSFGAATGGEAVVVTGVGQHQMWASQLMPCNNPYSFVTSGGLGTMGFGVPAALGAKVGRPDAPVVCIDGDGCFQMTAQELATATLEKIPFTVAILNNQHLGMVRQWQELFYDRRYSEVHLPPEVPDYVRLAEAYGAVGYRVTEPDEVGTVVDKALSVDDRPCVIDFRVDPAENCFPMIPAGASNDDIILGPDPSPEAVLKVRPSLLEEAAERGA